MAFETTGREEIKDKRFSDKKIESEYANKLFLRIAAKNVAFEKVDFKYTIFDTCYFRSCVFDSCDFTGCRFIGSSFHGSQFIGCKFDYSHFERTLIDSDILNSNAPSVENLKQRFARSLRMNYQSLGDSESVNKAIKLELQATKQHLFKAWNSNESYYRKKYVGWGRLFHFFKWFEVKGLDFVWGNGESILKLARTFLIIWILMAINDVILDGDTGRLNDYVDSFLSMPGLFLGTIKFDYYSEIYVSLIALLRLIMVSLFVSIIVKRYNRR